MRCDDMKAFPPPRKEVRYVLQLRKQSIHDICSKVELIVGKTVQTDERNHTSSAARWKRLEGWRIPTSISQLGPTGRHAHGNRSKRAESDRFSRLAAIPISSQHLCLSRSMYPKALKCIFGSRLPERRLQKQLEKGFDSDPNIGRIARLRACTRTPLRGAGDACRWPMSEK